MKLAEAMKSCDYDLPLLDALNDRELSPDRRVLAGALIGEALDKAYLPVRITSCSPPVASRSWTATA